MGKFIAGFLERFGFEVVIADRVLGGKSNKELAESCDVVVVSVPISATADVIREVAPHMKKGALLVEICSLKARLKEVLGFAEGFDIEILSLHPLFGPIDGLEGLNVIEIPVKPGEKSRRVVEFLEWLGLNVTRSTLEEHDRKVAVTQAIFHHVMFELGRIADLRFATANFNMMTGKYSNAKKQKELFEPIIFENQFFKQEFTKFMNRLENTIPKGIK